MSHRRAPVCLLISSLLAASLLAPTDTYANPNPFNGKILLVAVNGLDSTACGVPANPCRSISQAIANAAAGDTILVRPGLYGDVNKDGVLSGAGEETGTNIGALNINKRVRVISSEGAGATVIDVSAAKQGVVEISASGAQFGEKDAGFTVKGGWLQGVFVNLVTTAVVAGNTVRGIPESVSLVGSEAMYVISGGVVEIRDNLLIDNPGSGIVTAPASDTAYVSIHDNVVTGSHAAEGSAGILVANASPHQVYRNTISDNSIGLIVNYGTSRIFNNIVTGNDFGVQLGGIPATVPARGPSLTRNSFTANKFFGLYIYNGTPAAITIRENNFYGNSLNCGISNQASGTIDARGNFWGASTGPSEVDPADSVCGGGGPVTTTPFATREFPVR